MNNPKYKVRLRPYLHLVLAVLVAAGLRLDLLFANNFVIDADEAIVGLMGAHIASGKDLPIFFYGQAYMGSLEAFTAAALFEIFGVSSIALKLAPLLWSLLLLPIIFVFAKQAADDRVAVLTVYLAAICPSALVVWSSMARGGFIEVLVLGSAASLCCLMFTKAVNPGSKQVYFCLTALLLGMGWWTNNQIIYWFPVITGVLLWKGVQIGFFGLAQQAFCGVFFFLVGSLPFWFYNITHQFSSFSLFKKTESSLELGAHVKGLVQIALPILLGARRFWSTEDLYPGATLLVVLLVAMIFFAAIFSSKQRPIVICAIFFIFTVCAVFVSTPFGSLVSAPRYLLPIYPALFLVSAIGILYLYDLIKSVGVSFFLILLAVNLLSTYSGGRTIPGEPFVFDGQRVSKDHSELITWLKGHSYSWVKTNYWIGYRLAFETSEQIRFIILAEPDQVRLPEYELEGQQQPLAAVPLVLVPSESKLVERALTLLGYSYKKAQASGYDVVYQINNRTFPSTPIDSSDLSFTSSVSSSTLALVHDGDLRTRWGSAGHQSPGMQFEITLDPVRTVTGIRYDLGAFESDYPRALRVTLISLTGIKTIVFDGADIDAVRYLQKNDQLMQLFFDPVSETHKIHFELIGSHPVFDWSVAELSILAQP